MSLWQIHVDGIGPRKRYWLRYHTKDPFGPFFNTEALLRAINRYVGLASTFTGEDLACCFEGGSRPYKPFSIEFTGVPTGPHREKHRPEFVLTKPEPSLDPEVEELMGALGDPLAPPSAIDTLTKTLCNGWNGCRRADIELRRAKLVGFSTAAFFDEESGCDELNLSGDFSWSNFSEARFVGGATEPPSGFPIVLSGWFIGSNLTNSEFNNVHLCGDFSRCNFTGAKLTNCRLSGNFNRAVLPINLHNCEISATASFKGADLRRATGLISDARQVYGAHLDSTSGLDVSDGSSITICGEEYGLRRPAHLEKGVRFAAGNRETASLTTEPMIPLSVVESIQTSAEKWLYDLRDRDSGRLWGWTPETSKYRTPHMSFHLHAPGIVLRGIQASEVGRIRLFGNFDGARLTDSDIPWLEVRAGSFRGFDLTDCILNQLWLHLSSTDTSGIRLPKTCERVVLAYKYHDDEDRFDAPAGRVLEIVDAWNSRPKCEMLAQRLLPAAQTLSEAFLKRVGKSRACTVRKLCREMPYPDGDGVVFLALIARINQLKATAAGLK